MLIFDLVCNIVMISVTALVVLIVVILILSEEGK